MSGVRVMVARFPFGRSENPAIADWLVETVVKMKADERIGEIIPWRLDDTPITMGRNRCIEWALASEIDFLLLIDNDMEPDAHLRGGMSPLPVHPEAKPFWDTSFDFLLAKRRASELAVVAAPYCGPPPHENVYIFHWSTLESDNDAAPFSLGQYSREHADAMRGIQEVAALPTGLMLLDMEGVKRLEPPYFYYEWPDERAQEKASTEDVTFTRDLSLQGVSQYCNWDAWAGHWKRKCVGRPVILPPGAIGEKLRRAVLRQANINDPSEQLLYWRFGKEARREATDVEREASRNGDSAEVPVHVTGGAGGAGERGAGAEEEVS
jgi:hypothetical protein